ncbi:aminoacyl-tRNA deacylase [Thermodesulfobacteriota bacterium]
MSVTPAIRFLRKSKIPFEVREYDPKEKGAEFAAKALNWPLESMVKTLVVALSDGSFVLCCLPGDEELSLKSLARAAGVKGARMTTPKEAEKLTGYFVGGISPFGTRKRMAVWMHETILGFDEIGINGGRRGTMLFLDPKLARDAVNAQVANLAA